MKVASKHSKGERNMSKNIIQLNEEAVKGELKELVRKSVEETLNELLDKEAEELTGAARYERNEARQGYRSGHYSRKLSTTFGKAVLNMPKLKGVTFEMAIIDSRIVGPAHNLRTLSC